MKKILVILSLIIFSSAQAGVQEDIVKLEDAKRIHTYISENVESCRDIILSINGLQELSEKSRVNNSDNPYLEMIDSLTSDYIEEGC